MNLRPLLLIGLVCGSGCASFRQADDPWWGPDKAKHFAGSFALAAGATLALDPSMEGDQAALTGFAVGMTAGAGKEYYDRTVKRTYFSGKDFVWDLAGGLLGSLAGAALADE